MLLDERPVADGPGEAATFRPCANCNAGLLAGQEWCVECGERQPSRETARRSRRVAVLVVAGVLVLAGTGSAVAWFAVKDKASRASRGLLASAPGPAGAAGTTPGAAVPGQVTPGVGTPATTTPLNPSTLPTIGDTTPSLITVGTPKSTSTTTTTTTSGGKRTTSTTTSKAKAKEKAKTPLPKVPLAPRYKGGFSPTNAVGYDPFGTDRVENPQLTRNAIDRDITTAWATADYPTGFGKPGVGIYFDVGSAKNVTYMNLNTDTPGFNIEVYGAEDSPHPTGAVPGPGWVNLASSTIDAKRKGVPLHTLTSQYQYYLLYITSLPAKATHVDINEVSFHARLP